MTATVCALAGYFTERSLRPPPPGLARPHRFRPDHPARGCGWSARRIGVTGVAGLAGL